MKNVNCDMCGIAVTDHVKCGQCGNMLHFKCAGIAETTYRKLGPEKKANWRCLSCRNTHSSNNDSALSEILLEIKALRKDFCLLKSDFVTVKVDVRNISQEVKDLTSKWTFDGGTRDQLSRLNNLEISGIPISKGENLNTILHTVCNKAGFTLKETDIDTIHRVRRFSSGNDTKQRDSRPPAIIVSFTQRRRKDELLACVRARRGLSTTDVDLPGAPLPIYLSDHLTPAKKILLKLARELKNELGYSYLWVRDCKIMMRKNDTSKFIRITNENDLLSLK
ncbi:hypothetical protein ACJJTC_010745 [Scirpophaga incertulas]